MATEQARALDERHTRSYVRTITPQLATTLLETNQANRPINQTYLARFAAAMREGRWRLNGETIKISENHVLLDGQHRLYACIEADVPFQSWVIEGIPADVFDTIDIGRPKSAANFLSVRGCHQATKVAAAIRWTIFLESPSSGDRNKSSISTDEVVSFWLANPEINEAVLIADQAARALSIATGVCAALFFLFSKKSQIEALRFFQDLSSGADLHQGDAVFLLRSIITRRQGSQRARRELAVDLPSLMIRAWNNRRRGLSPRQLKAAMPDEKGRNQIPVIV